MRRYYFHTDSKQDMKGVYLSTLAKAKSEAMAVACRMVRDPEGAFWRSAEWCLPVTDQNNLTQFQLNIVGTEAPILASSAG